MLDERAVMQRPCGQCGRPFEVKRADSPARFCRGCRPMALAASMRVRWETKRKYRWTPALDEVLRKDYDGRVKDRAREIAERIGWPAWVIKKRAALLGLTSGWPECRRSWTAEEEKVLLESAGHFSAHWMARKLGRSETQVVLKLKRLHLSRRWQDGYTMRQLEMCFGVDHRVISKWIASGWLPDRRRDDSEPNEDPSRRSMCVTDADLLRFMQEHPMEFDVRRVDQFWFMGLILGGKLLLEALRRVEKVSAETQETRIDWRAG